MTQHQILIIDNNATALCTAGEILEKNGYQVTLATNSESGTQFIEKGCFSLALVEVAQNDILALSTLKTIRTASPDSMVVFQSDCAESDLKGNMFKTGADDYIFKPYQAEELLFRVKKNIEDYELKQGRKIRKKILCGCCVCKKIRIDDNGPFDDRWMEVEDFLKKELDILLSSTYCPKCAQAAHRDLQVHLGRL
jgi:DNA-binding response OmpR family regulator